MNPPQAKKIFGISAILLPVLMAAFIVKIFPYVTSGSEVHKGFLEIALLAFNLIILMGWFVFGRGGGALIFVFACITALGAAANFGGIRYVLHLPIFLVSVIVSETRLQATESFLANFNTELERFEEEKNIFSDDLSHKSAHIDAVKKKISTYSKLKEVTEVLSNTLVLDEICQHLINESFHLLGKAERILLYLIDEGEREPYLKMSRQKVVGESIRSKRGDIFDTWVLKHRTPLIVQNASNDFRFSPDHIPHEPLRVKSIISAPLMAGSKTLGLIRMDGPSEDLFSADDLRLLDIIADLGTVAIENAQLYLITRELAINDGLTGLFVRRYFMERLGLELTRSLSREESISLLMIDIDHFKIYNDTYGHTAGDILLKRLAQILRSFTRPGDIAARYGGEEFVLVLVDMNKTAARKVASDIRDRVAKESFILRRKPTNVTISIGIAASPADSTMEEDLIKAADANLYKAKETGRNRICY